MTSDDGITESRASQSTQDEAAARPIHEEILAAHLPPQEVDQPDPILQLSVGRLGAGSITLAAIVGAIILAVVLYGLNSPAPNAQDVGAPKTASSAPAPGGNAPAAAPATQHASGGHS